MNKIVKNCMVLLMVVSGLYGMHTNFTDYHDEEVAVAALFDSEISDRALVEIMQLHSNNDVIKSIVDQADHLRKRLQALNAQRRSPQHHGGSGSFSNRPSAYADDTSGAVPPPLVGFESLVPSAALLDGNYRESDDDSDDDNAQAVYESRVYDVAEAIYNDDVSDRELTSFKPTYNRLDESDHFHTWQRMSRYDFFKMMATMKMNEPSRYESIVHQLPLDLQNNLWWGEIIAFVNKHMNKSSAEFEAARTDFESRTGGRAVIAVDHMMDCLACFNKGTLTSEVLRQYDFNIIDCVNELFPSDGSRRTRDWKEIFTRYKAEAQRGAPAASERQQSNARQEQKSVVTDAVRNLQACTSFAAFYNCLKRMDRDTRRSIMAGNYQLSRSYCLGFNFVKCFFADISRGYFNVQALDQCFEDNVEVYQFILESLLRMRHPEHLNEEINEYLLQKALQASSSGDLCLPPRRAQPAGLGDLPCAVAADDDDADLQAALRASRRHFHACDDDSERVLQSAAAAEEPLLVVNPQSQQPQKPSSSMEDVD